MRKTLEDFKELFLTQTIQVNNNYIKKVLSKFSFFLLGEDYDIIFNIPKNLKFKDMFINIYSESENNTTPLDYFNICFDYKLFIIPTKSFHKIFHLFSENKQAIIHCISKDIKTIVQSKCKQI